MYLSVKLACLLLAIVVAGSTIRFYYRKFFSRWGLSDNVPWVDAEDGGLLSLARVTLKSFFDSRQLIETGYLKYSKNGLPFVLPNITTGPEVILPASQLEWVLQQPDNVLDQEKVNQRFLQAQHTMLHPRVIDDSVHIDIIRNEMSKQLGLVTDDVNDEVDFAMRKSWGIDTREWTEVCVYDTILEIIGRVSLRVLVGLPLCRDEKFLVNSMNFARLVVVQAVFLNMIPELFRPIIAPFVNMLDTIKFMKCAKYLTPIIKKRNSSPLADEKKPFDYVQWSIDQSHVNNDPSERSVDLITRRFNIIGFAAIQSSVITASNLLLDLAASPLTPSYFATVREEVKAELGSAGGIWTKQALARMTSLDSGLRESMRLWGFVSRGILKEVVAKEGVTMPSGLHLPMGVKVGVHSFPIHHDEDVYQNAQSFMPLRFCTPASTTEEESDDSGSDTMRGSQGKRGTPLVTTSSTFMAFSHGRHSCPGRYFASQQLKLVLAYIAQNYEIEPITKRPNNQWLVGSLGPPMDFKIRIRRREGTV